jgi:hypothetical protein
MQSYIVLGFMCWNVNLVVNKNMRIQKLEQRLGKEIKLQ